MGWVWFTPSIEHSGEDGYVLEWVRFCPQLNIMDRLVTHWNGFRVWFPPPIEHSGEDGYVLEWVWFSPQLKHYG